MGYRKSVSITSSHVLQTQTRVKEKNAISLIFFTSYARCLEDEMDMQFVVLTIIFASVIPSWFDQLMLYGNLYAGRRSMCRGHAAAPLISYYCRIGNATTYALYLLFRRPERLISAAGLASYIIFISFIYFVVSFDG